jgi:hypothetical protein
LRASIANAQESEREEEVNEKKKTELPISKPEVKDAVCMTWEEIGLVGRK